MIGSSRLFEVGAPPNAARFTGGVPFAKKIVQLNFPGAMEAPFFASRFKCLDKSADSPPIVVVVPVSISRIVESGVVSVRFGIVVLL